MRAIEVFKTDVTERDHADMLIEQIHRHFAGYKANFDLHDCDNILRIQSATGIIQTAGLISFLKDLGADAEVLADELPTPSKITHTKILFLYE